MHFVLSGAAVAVVVVVVVVAFCGAAINKIPVFVTGDGQSWREIKKRSHGQEGEGTSFKNRKGPSQLNLFLCQCRTESAGLSGRGGEGRRPEWT